MTKTAVPCTASMLLHSLHSGLHSCLFKEARRNTAVGKFVLHYAGLSILSMARISVKVDLVRMTDCTASLSKPKRKFMTTVLFSTQNKHT